MFLILLKYFDQHTSTSKKVKCFGDVSSSQGWVQRAISVGKTIDITRTEHNHPPDQASNKAKKLVSSLHEEGKIQPYSDYLDAIKYQSGL